MISIEHLAMHIGARVLFDDVNLTLNAGSRYGIVGANGSGKSTFLQLVAGVEEPSFGNITVAKKGTLGWLKQDQYLFDDEPLIDIVLRGKEKLWTALKEKEKLLEQENWDEKAAFRVSALEEIIASEGGYEAEGVAASLLSGLGIQEEVHQSPLKILSGGFKLRVLLARALFNNPDVLLLDEPTNYLDIVTIHWLEGYLLSQFKGVLLVVSHDHSFLNKVCSHILDIDYADIRLYTGNYKNFIVQKALVEEQKLNEKKHLDQYVARQRLFIERFRASATRSKQAQSRERHLEKLEWPKIEKSSREKPSFSFHLRRPHGKTGLKVNKVSKSFPGRPLFQKIDFTLLREEKLALLGPNGYGKSTLLKILLGEESSDEGSIEWGHQVSIAYFAQNHRDYVHWPYTVLDYLHKECPDIPEEQLRRALGQVLFTKDDVQKSIEILSGGEVSRLLIASMMLKKPNLLILDEPTNHLDMEGRDALAEALSRFEGTLILVSHDRHFISSVATRLLIFSPEGWSLTDESYEEFERKR